MSVIIGRALPDVRDGLKPVHRRVLYGMSQQGNVWNKAYKKSARIVGDVMGKFHPHGDAAIYDTVVRMAQHFAMRYVLVDGQGNFGSVDGDPPAAMRYTEVRMARIADEILADIDKETVDFVDNYDGSEQEPTVLPARFPNLLVNGSSGIAVGMSTNIPPHNLAETIGAVIHLIEHPEANIADLMQFIPGPDFPTAALVCGYAGIREAYETGRGSIQMRARAEIEVDDKQDRQRIVVTELPYQVNKARLLEKIAELVKDKRVEGISGLRDESDRRGMRMVVELKRDAVAEVVLNQLFKHTQLQSTFGVIMLAIVAGQPRLLNLKDVLASFIEHRREVTVRRCRFELRRASEREHILEGYKIALDHIDRIVELIRASAGPKEAKAALMEEFSLSDVQAQAILEMRLQRLTGLEREKIIQELHDVRAEIARLEAILASETLLLDVIKTELNDIKSRYGDERRTQIVPDPQEIDIEDMIAREDVVVTLSHGGYVKRSPVSLYRAQRRGGVGRTGMKTREEDFVRDMYVASTHDYVLFFTNKGVVYWLKVHQIPDAGPTARGKAVVNLLPLDPDEKITAVLPVAEFTEGRHIVFATRCGVIKKTDLMAFANVRRGMGIRAIILDEGDGLIGASITSGNQEILLGTRRGMAVRFRESDARPMGRSARGVTGIRFKHSGDEVIGMVVLREGATILSICVNGYGKRTPTEDYRLTGRGAQGVISIDTGERNGDMVAILQVVPEEDVMLITDTGNMIRTPVSDIPVVGRSAMGVVLKRMEGGETLVAASVVAERAAGGDVDEGGGGGDEEAGDVADADASSAEPGPPEGA
jgi:DNA gyrase subunit A